ncbi:AAA family ATPase [Granulicatella adiacens]|uniref:AAA family ATPase n=1 Tax=Granulicatella adiacens TaxID=46124 RepID=UPI0021A61917|nr:AAA family ATPase [Granulicatella adiacens]MCT2160478.1 AAA family ATPase [Granulicatella adiacens]
MKYKFFKDDLEMNSTKNNDKDVLYFIQTSWNDFNFYTLFSAYAPRENGKNIKLGYINVANLDAKLNNDLYYSTLDELQIGLGYERLPQGFVSLGSEDFYYNLHETFTKKECKKILSDLNDLCLAYDQYQKEDYFYKPVIQSSLLRDHTEEQASKFIESTLKPVAEHGKRAGYNITYKYSFKNKPVSKFNFISNPKDIFPQNVHAIIGANGSGKTTFIKDILSLVLDTESKDSKEIKVKSQFKKDNSNLYISFSTPDRIKVESTQDYFSKVILISFSPFDNLFSEKWDSKEGDKDVTYLGLYQKGNSLIDAEYQLTRFCNLISNLKNNKDNWDLFKEILDQQDFKGDIRPIVDQIDTVMSQGATIKKNLAKLQDLFNQQDFKEAFDIMSNDIKENNVPILQSILNLRGYLNKDNLKESTNSLLDELDKVTNPEDIKKKLEPIFEKMSAGQKIILLSIATLIIEVEQFSLVLIDEPELFLHPPMISNYIRSISDIMRKKNGLCILTTHSPIIIQEIPRTCVKIIKSNNEGGISMETPTYETLGENLSTLTNTIFGLNQYESGFYQLIKDLVDNPEKYKLDYEKIDNLEFGRDGMLYKDLLLSDVYEGGDINV